MKNKERIVELEKQVETLKAKLKRANERIAQQQTQNYRYDNDYLPYEDRYE